MKYFKHIKFLAIAFAFFSVKATYLQALTAEDMRLNNLSEAFTDGEYKDHKLAGLDAIGALMQGTQINPQSPHLQGIQPLNVFGKDIVFQDLPEQQQEALKKWAMFPTDTLGEGGKHLQFRVFAYFAAAFEKGNDVHYLWTYKLIDKNVSEETTKQEPLDLKEIESRIENLKRCFNRYNVLKEGDLSMPSGLKAWEKQFHDALESDDQEVMNRIKADISCLEEIAEMGIVHAQLLCGYVYNQGICGMKEDNELCERYFTTAANQEHLRGNVFLAGFLQEKERYAEAFPRWDFAARNGYHFALCICAEMLESGLGTDKNPKSAIMYNNTYVRMIGQMPAEVLDEDSKRLYIAAMLSLTFGYMVVEKPTQNNTSINNIQVAFNSLDQLVKFILSIQKTGEEAAINYAEIVQKKASEKLKVWVEILKDHTVQVITEQERFIQFPEVEETFYPYFKATLKVALSKLLAGDYIAARRAMNAACVVANTCPGTPPVGATMQTVMMDAYTAYEVEKASKELPMHSTKQ